jgi:hypothetical protein
MWMARLLRFIEPAQKTQPSCRAADEPLPGFAGRRSTTPASLRTRPDCGRSLDAESTHPFAHRQVQKANHVEKVVHAFDQSRPTGTGLLEMLEIARPLLRKWRRSVLLNGSGKVEELFKHDCVSLFVEAQPWPQEEVKNIMLRRSYSAIHTNCLLASDAT